MGTPVTNVARELGVDPITLPSNFGLSSPASQIGCPPLVNSHGSEGLWFSHAGWAGGQAGANGPCTSWTPG